MGNNNFLKPGAFILWIAVSVCSCYLTVESFYLLLEKPRWVLWILALAFFAISSFGTKRFPLDCLHVPLSIMRLKLSNNQYHLSIIVLILSNNPVSLSIKQKKEIPIPGISFENLTYFSVLLNVFLQLNTFLRNLQAFHALHLLTLPVLLIRIFHSIIYQILI